jgi:hypothetical protein
MGRGNKLIKYRYWSYPPLLLRIFVLCKQYFKEIYFVIAL